MSKETTIKVDGAAPYSIGATKFGGTGLVMYDEQKNIVFSDKRYHIFPYMTSNMIEFLAVEMALETAVRFDEGQHFIIQSDSRYTFNCWHNPDLVKKDHLVAIKRRWFELAAKIQWRVSVHWINRECNTEADALSKQAVADFKKEFERNDNNEVDMAF